MAAVNNVVMWLEYHAEGFKMHIMKFCEENQAAEINIIEKFDKHEQL